MRDFGLGRCRKPGQQKFATWLPVTFQFVGIWFSVRRALILSSAVYDSQFAVFWFSVRRNPILRWGAAFSTKIRLEIRFTTWPPSGSSAGWLQFQAKCEAQPSDGREIFEKNEKKVRPNIPRKSETAVFAPEDVFPGAETMRDRFSSLCSTNPARFQRLTTSQSRVMNFSKQVLISGILCSCTYFQFSSHSQNLESTGALGLSVVQADVRTVCFATGRPGCGPNFHPNFWSKIPSIARKRSPTQRWAKALLFGQLGGRFWSSGQHGCGPCNVLLFDFARVAGADSREARFQFSKNDDVEIPKSAIEKYENCVPKNLEIGCRIRPVPYINLNKFAF